MDFTPELSAFQGVIISTDNIHPFSKLTAKGGNEDKINSVINNIMKFLKDQRFINNSEGERMLPQIRKFALYIILNGDLRTLEQLVEKEEIDLVIWTIPTIPKCLMCELIYNLSMEQFLYEVIVFSYPPLGLEVAEAFLDHLKYFGPTDCLEKLRKLSVACYTLICRLNLFEFEGNCYLKNLTNAKNNFQKCIKYLTEPPNSERLNSLRTNDLYKYKGKCLTAALMFVYECLNQFTSKQENKPSGFDDIYCLTHLEECVKNGIISYHISDSSKEILELLHECNIMMLDASKQLIMDVSVDIFCAWSEFEENGKSMQQSIGELCHKLRTKFLTIENLSEHPVVSMIEQIARKPADIRDLVNSTDEVTIKEKINSNNEDSEAWLHALIDKDQLCNYIELLDIISENLAKFSDDECQKLYEVLKNSSENKEYTETLAVKAFQCCNILVKYKLLDKQFIKNCFIDMQETSEFAIMMTETFNKLVIQPDADLSDILTLFLQNPKEVYIKIFNLALENSHQAEIMIRVMKLLEKYSNHYYGNETEPCIIKVAQKIFEMNLETEVKQNNFIKFLCGLKDANIIPGTKLLLLLIMPNIHKALLNKSINILDIQMRLLRNAYPLEELVEYRAPMLAMLAQVFDVVRWKIHTFTALAPVALQSAMMLQTSLMESYNENIPDNEGTWLRSKLKKTHPLNMYYYRHLWNPPGNNFLEIISGMSITKDTSIEEITSWLIQILCSCSQQEWYDIWDSLSLLGDTATLTAFHEAMLAISTAEKTNSTYNTWLCLLYCYRNLIYIIRYKFLKEPLTDNQVIAVIKKIAVMPVIKKGQSDEIEALFLPLFAYLAEKKNQYTFDVTTCIQLKQKNLDNLVEKLFTHRPV